MTSTITRRLLLQGGAMLPGLGRPTPSRFPYPKRPESSPGIGAATGQILRARKVIITGPNGQFLAYSTSTPQPDALVASFTVTAMSDGAGNTTVPGWVAYYSSGGIQYAEQTGSGEIAIWSTGNTHQAGPWGLLSQGIFFQPAGATQLFSQSGQPVGLNGVFLVNNGAGPIATNQMIAFAPGGGTVPDTWHSDLGALTGYVVNRARYKFTPWNTVILDLSVTGGGANAATVTFANALDFSGYFPLASYTLPLTSNQAAPTALPRLGVTAAGAVSVSFQANITTTVIGVVQWPLD